ncbi:hypothetical protein G3446_23780 [Thiorhodococcus minor]|uniref:Uncharacterized protein n=2 Tax=Thiorhodococcus minor TaxID=57489 RepID=A0A6M0K561_9GAMM|nr:hypothetical protein [Thiorhodococcus minor]
MAIYGSGDALAAWILGELSLGRSIGMVMIGGFLYGVEVPNWFRWIDRHSGQGGWKASLGRTWWALIYFNPLWIARHLAFIALFSGDWSRIGWGLLQTGLWSFLANIPVAVLANWVIQNRLPLRLRFVASALFSALMAVYYALSARIF